MQLATFEFSPDAGRFDQHASTVEELAINQGTRAL
jgi:hypothetical protein